MAYTTIDDPSAYFQTALYTGGNGSNNTPIDVTNSGNSDLQPDWVWIKRRDNAASHGLFDSSRGVNKILNSDSTDAEVTGETDLLDEFKTDGFGLGANTGSENVNKGGTSYVAWQWKANGGTTASNTDGTITSTVQANTTAGFSIVTFTGTGNDGDSYGHGLTSAPELVFPKRRDATSNWQGYAFDGGNSQYFYLNLTNAFASTSGNSAASSSSVITTDGSGDSNPNGGTVVSYCFHSVKGYSKIGRYTGNGNADGPMVFCGFKPAWVLVKNSSGSGFNWTLHDNKRNEFNLTNRKLEPNTSNAEDTVYDVMDFYSNGFKCRTGDAGINASGTTYIYMAFAEHPFVSSDGIPTTAR